MIRIRHSDHGPEQFQKLVVCLSDYFIELRLQLFELSCSMIHTHTKRDTDKQSERERGRERDDTHRKILSDMLINTNQHVPRFSSRSHDDDNVVFRLLVSSRVISASSSRRALWSCRLTSCAYGSQSFAFVVAATAGTALVSSSSSSSCCCLSATQRHRERHSCSSSCPFRPDL